MKNNGAVHCAHVWFVKLEEGYSSHLVSIINVDNQHHGVESIEQMQEILAEAATICP